MKRLIIVFAAILIALPLTAQRRVSKRSSEKDRKETRKHVNHVKRDRKTSARKVSRNHSGKKKTYNINRSERQRSVKQVQKRRSVKRDQKRRSVKRDQSRRSGINSSGRVDVNRNKTKRSQQGRSINSYNRKKTPSKRGVARNSYYGREHHRRAYGKSHGHINRFYHGRKVARNQYHIYNRPHQRIVFRHSWFNFYVNYFPRYSIRYNRYVDVIPGDAARYHVGDLKVVYGRVYETYYDPRAEEFYLYFGAPYPGQDLTVVVTGRDARRLSRKHARYFIGWDFSVAGLISSFDGKPEIIINDKNQLNRF